MKKETDVEFCPICGGRVGRNHLTGENVCQHCGLVVDRVLDFRPAQRAYDQEQRGRAGPPLTPERRAQTYRLRKWRRQASTSSTEDRNLAKASNIMSHVTSYLRIPNGAREEAAVLYRRARKLALGRNIERIAVATLYITCRKRQISRTFHEFADASGFKRKELIRSYIFLKRQLRIHTQAADPGEYMARIAYKLGLSDKVQARATKLLNRMKSKQGRSPAILAAAAIYVAALQEGEHRTKKDVAKAAGVTDVSIRTAIKDAHTVRSYLLF